MLVFVLVCSNCVVKSTLIAIFFLIQLDIFNGKGYRTIFDRWFTFCPDVQNYRIVSSSPDKIFKPSYKTDCYRKNSITRGVINCTKKTQNQFSNLPLKTLAKLKLKVYNLKIALKIINEEVKGVNLIKQIKSILISSRIS